MNRKRVFVGNVNAAPTPEAYAQSLCDIVRNGMETAGVNWAISEVVKFTKLAAESNPDAWARD